MKNSKNTGVPVKYKTKEERIRAFMKAVSLRREWEECSRLGLTFEQMMARGVKPLRVS